MTDEMAETAGKLMVENAGTPWGRVEALRDAIFCGGPAILSVHVGICDETGLIAAVFEVNGVHYPLFPAEFRHFVDAMRRCSDAPSDQFARLADALEDAKIVEEMKIVDAMARALAAIEKEKAGEGR